MKKTLNLLLFALLANILLQAQSNNPYNQTGIDFYNSLKVIKADYNAGLIKGISEASIKTCVEKIPVKCQMDVSLATQVYNAYRAAVNTNDITGGVNNSALSAEGKIQLLSLIRDSKTLNKTNIATYLTNHVSQINDSKTIGTNEKALLLTIDAIVYNAAVWSTRTVEGGFSGNYVENPCIFFGGAGSFETGGTACIIGGAIIGGVIGYTICGWPCAIGGAILGGILGGVSS